MKRPRIGDLRGYRHLKTLVCESRAQAGRDGGEPGCLGRPVRGIDQAHRVRATLTHRLHGRMMTKVRGEIHIRAGGTRGLDEGPTGSAAYRDRPDRSIGTARRPQAPGRRWQDVRGEIDQNDTDAAAPEAPADIGLGRPPLKLTPLNAGPSFSECHQPRP